MAVIKRGILGGFQNKIANVVGSSWKGIATMRSLPISVANPRTAPQVRQRTKFGAASQYASQILPTIIKPLWDRFAQQESGYNAWVRTNLPFINDLGVIDLEKIIISKGILAPLAITDASINHQFGTLRIQWNTEASGDGLSTDRLYAVLYSQGLDTMYGFPSIAARDAGIVNFQMPSDMDWTQGYNLYVAMKSVDGTKVSNSVWFPGQL